MTALKKLLTEFEILRQKYRNEGLSFGAIVDELEETLNQKFVVDTKSENQFSRSDLVVEIQRLNNELLSANALIKTLKNQSEVNHNNPDEQSTLTDEELMSKIEDMVLKLVQLFEFAEKVEETEEFKVFKQELKSLFQTYRNTVSTAVNQESDTLVDGAELLSEIKNAMNSLKIEFTQTGESLGDYSGYYSISNKNMVAEYLLKLFKTLSHKNIQPEGR
jgi:hypothetical protein